MMRKLMIDSLLTWAKVYKVDGFRFDLMGHHMKEDILAVRAELDRLSADVGGIDGTQIVLYGEGWDFGEVANNARGENATQQNMAGTGIGTFNDRLRDAVRGGGPFSGQQDQGYATGLYTNPNESDPRSENQRLQELLKLKDWIRISLAGNLASYPLVDYQGNQVTGQDISYNGLPAGYTQTPQENIAYVSAHDNETLFDAIQFKLPVNASLPERVRSQNLALSLVAYSQGIPFFHAGSELIRSKSMDRDSYDSSDWFNAIDWTFQDNNWGHGLPLRDHNGNLWALIQPLLANPEIAPTEEHIILSRNLFGNLLQIRTSSPLFRLQTTQQIIDLVRFHNTGPDQIPGLIAMSVSDDPVADLDPNYDVIMVLFNADPRTISFKLNGWQTNELQLHPAQNQDPTLSLAKFDPSTQTFIIPGSTAVVFVGKTPLKPVDEFQSPMQEEITPESPPLDEAVTDTPDKTEVQTQVTTQTPTTGTGSHHWIGWLVGGLALLTGISAIAIHQTKKRKSHEGQ
jgi:pullulanase-type alpha-1,6-glucosidase